MQLHLYGTVNNYMYCNNLKCDAKHQHHDETLNLIQIVVGQERVVFLCGNECRRKTPFPASVHLVLTGRRVNKLQLPLQSNG